MTLSRRKKSGRAAGRGGLPLFVAQTRAAIKAAFEPLPTRDIRELLDSLKGRDTPSMNKGLSPNKLLDAFN
jgi:hypothetical protein